MGEGRVEELEADQAGVVKSVLQYRTEYNVVVTVTGLKVSCCPSFAGMILLLMP